MGHRVTTVGVIALCVLLLGASAASACGGLIAPGHAEVLRKASTLAAWIDGNEHYITGFTFAGSADKFGYIIPLPGVPTKIEKGGEWTLERLEREVEPPVRELALFSKAASAGGGAGVTILQQVKIDALDIKILRGGGPDVAKWARANGFPLDFNADYVFGHYSSSKAIFAAAWFDRADAKKRGLLEGQGQTIHFTIPTPGPWIPLRVLTLGKPADETIDADLFILTAHTPKMYPTIETMPGMKVRYQKSASESLLNDLRGDKGMSWVPSSMVLTALQLNAPAGTVDYDLGIDGGRPVGAPTAPKPHSVPPWAWWLTLTTLAAAAIASLARTAKPQPAAQS